MGLLPRPIAKAIALAVVARRAYTPEGLKGFFSVNSILKLLGYLDALGAAALN
jgi:hypothetical protein